MVNLKCKSELDLRKLILDDINKLSPDVSSIPNDIQDQLKHIFYEYYVKGYKLAVRMNAKYMRALIEQI